jgi:hypothetical protein
MDGGSVVFRFTVVERGLLLPLVHPSLRLGVADAKGALDNLLKGAATQCMQVSNWNQ